MTTSKKIFLGIVTAITLACMGFAVVVAAVDANAAEVPFPAAEVDEQKLPPNRAGSEPTTMDADAIERLTTPPGEIVVDPSRQACTDNLHKTFGATAENLMPPQEQMYRFVLTLGLVSHTRNTVTDANGETREVQTCLFAGTSGEQMSFLHVTLDRGMIYVMRSIPIAGQLLDWTGNPVTVRVDQPVDTDEPTGGGTSGSVNPYRQTPVAPDSR